MTRVISSQIGPAHRHTPFTGINTDNPLIRLPDEIFNNKIDKFLLLKDLTKAKCVCNYFDNALKTKSLKEKAEQEADLCVTALESNDDSLEFFKSIKNYTVPENLVKPIIIQKIYDRTIIKTTTIDNETQLKCLLEISNFLKINRCNKVIIDLLYKMADIVNQTPITENNNLQMKKEIKTLLIHLKNSLSNEKLFDLLDTIIPTINCDETKKNLILSFKKASRNRLCKLVKITIKSMNNSQAMAELIFGVQDNLTTVQLIQLTELTTPKMHDNDQKNNLINFVKDQAAIPGNYEAQCRVGLMYYKGQGVAKDLPQARKWFEQAATLGYAPAQNNLGVMYKNREGGLQSFTKARKWFERAADKGHAHAQFNLGKMYSKGQSVPQNFTIARK